MRGVLVGRVVRLQVQTAPLKGAGGPPRRYDPAPIRAVEELLVGPAGAIGRVAGSELLDVHHRNHPHSRNPKGRSGLSVLSLADYARLRARFGPHIVDGVAGESLLLDTPTPLAAQAERLSPGLVVEAADGSALTLHSVRTAEPCVEFAWFCLGRWGGVDEEVRGAMAELAGGARGYRCVAGSTGIIRPGARLWELNLPSQRSGVASGLRAGGRPVAEVFEGL